MFVLLLQTERHKNNNVSMHFTQIFKIKNQLIKKNTLDIRYGFN